MNLRKTLAAAVAIALVPLGTLSVLTPVQADNHLAVVATGLDNPRGIEVGPDGSIWVAEAGRGGQGPCIPSPEGGDACLGLTGAVTRITAAGQQRVVTGLPSLAGAGGAAAIGPVDIAPNARGGADIIIGLGADPTLRTQLGANGRLLGHVAHLTANGQVQAGADVAGFELLMNPHPALVDSNPYSLVAVSGGNVVADAGGNDLLWVPAGGTITPIAIFQDRMVPAPPFLGLPAGTEIPMNSVPTTVAVGPDGAYYAGELTGFPFPQGAARVFRVVPGEDPEVVATGFTNIIDIDFGPDGSLYVLEIATESLLAAGEDAPPVGALWRIWPTGSVTMVASEGLIAPGGVAVADDGSIYVTNFSILPGLGQVVWIGGPAAAPAQAPGQAPWK